MGVPRDCTGKRRAHTPAELFGSAIIETAPRHRLVFGPSCPHTSANATLANSASIDANSHGVEWKP
jgi:hypothetical protein